MPNDKHGKKLREKHKVLVTVPVQKECTVTKITSANPQVANVEVSDDAGNVVAYNSKDVELHPAEEPAPLDPGEAPGESVKQAGAPAFTPNAPSAAPVASSPAPVAERPASTQPLNTLPLDETIPASREDVEKEQADERKKKKHGKTRTAGPDEPASGEVEDVGDGPHTAESPQPDITDVNNPD